MAIVDISDFDIFYISYDEPKKEEFWANILNQVPWANRVDGVKGFDTAHKECANQSATDRFITIDGDNIVDDKFFDLRLEIPDQYTYSTLSWCGRNIINGLVYGNGGVKLWHKSTMREMKSHENSETIQGQIEFCWEDSYVQMKNAYSTTYPNGSPFQAFRSGFREGVKMCLIEGERVGIEEFHKRIWKGNLERLLIWSSVGADIENGQWAMYGTRLGTDMVMNSDWDYTQVRDYDWFEDFWKTEISKDENEDMLSERIRFLGSKLRSDLGLNVAEMGPDESRFFKSVYHSIERAKLEFEVR